MTPLSKHQAEWLVLHAYLLLQYQQADKALTLLDAAITLQPDSMVAQRLLVVACLEAGCPERAKAVAQKLLRSVIAPQDKAALWLCISRASWRLDLPQQARSAHKQYLRFRQHTDQTVDGLIGFNGNE